MTSLMGCEIKVIKSSEQTFDVYGKDGKMVDGYIGISQGTLADLMKCCKACNTNIPKIEEPSIWQSILNIFKVNN